MCDLQRVLLCLVSMTRMCIDSKDCYHSIFIPSSSRERSHFSADGCVVFLSISVIPFRPVRSPASGRQFRSFKGGQMRGSKGCRAQKRDYRDFPLDIHFVAPHLGGLFFFSLFRLLLVIFLPKFFFGPEIKSFRHAFRASIVE